MHRKSIPVMLVMAVTITLMSMLSVDPWVWFPAGILVLVLAREMFQRTDQNLALTASLSFATIIALLLALLFNFYQADLGYRLKEIGVAIACLSLGFAIVVSMTSHTGLEMNRGLALLSSLFLALFLVSMIMLSLLLFDTLAGNTLIIDNRWIMFIVTDVSFLILGLWVMMVLMKQSIPFQGGTAR